MSNHSDMSAINNTLKAIEKKLERNAQLLSWILLLAAVGIVATILTFALK